VDCPNDLWPT